MATEFLFPEDHPFVRECLGMPIEAHREFLAESIEAFNDAYHEAGFGSKDRARAEELEERANVCSEILDWRLENQE